MARTFFICGNWKLNHTAEVAADTIAALSAAELGGVDVGIAPVITTLGACVQARGERALALGVQNVHWASAGAFTGEISCEHAQAAGASFAIVGHSERRQYFGESDETVQKRAAAAYAAGMTAVVCVGESLEERDAGETLSVVGRQLRAAIDGLSAADTARFVVAYEPVWAIGTGKTASAADAQAVHAALRGVLREAWGDAADAVRIVYGGSVKPANAEALLSEPDIDGALIGGASLKADSMLAIVQTAQRLAEA